MLLWSVFRAVLLYLCGVPLLVHPQCPVDCQPPVVQDGEVFLCGICGDRCLLRRPPGELVGNEVTDKGLQRQVGVAPQSPKSVLRGGFLIELVRWNMAQAPGALFVVGV